MARRLILDRKSSNGDRSVISYEPLRRENMLCLNYLVSRRKYAFNSAFDPDSIAAALSLANIDQDTDGSVNHMIESVLSASFYVDKRDNKHQRNR